jgi:DNA-binding transcriptional regulator YiaG
MATKKKERTNQGDAIFEGNTVGQLMVESLNELADDLKAGVDITKAYSCRNVTLEPKAESISPARIIQARKILGVSQTLFADFLGFSANSVRAWEQGLYQPQRAACILLEYIHEDPAYWRKKFMARIGAKKKSLTRTPHTKRRT